MKITICTFAGIVKCTVQSEEKDSIDSTHLYKETAKVLGTSLLFVRLFKPDGSIVQEEDVFHNDVELLCATIDIAKMTWKEASKIGKSPMRAVAEAHHPLANSHWHHPIITGGFETIRQESSEIPRAGDVLHAVRADKPFRFVIPARPPIILKATKANEQWETRLPQGLPALALVFTPLYLEAAGEDPTFYDVDWEYMVTEIRFDIVTSFFTFDAPNGKTYMAREGVFVAKEQQG